MDDIKERIIALLDEVEYEYVLKIWRQRLITIGMDESDANLWAGETRHVVDACRLALKYLADVFQEADESRIPARIIDWAAFAGDIPVFMIGNVTTYLQEKLGKYYPPEEEDDDEESRQ